MTLSAQIQLHAEQVFGSKDKADAWLDDPVIALGGLTPRQCAEVEAGYVQVKEMLDRLAHGYSA
ncbi:hypothetical protein D3C77_54430 [compost metagenome]